MNSLYKLSELLTLIMDLPANASLDAKFLELIAVTLDTSDHINAKLKILSIFDTAIDEISLLSISSNRIQDMVKYIITTKGKYLKACTMNSTDEFKSVMEIANTTAMLLSFGDTVASNTKINTSPFDRKSFLRDTQLLIETVGNCPMPPLQRDVLVIKLTAISRIVSECQYMSDDQIRHRVKSIVADFFSEFSSVDRKFGGAGENILKWAGNAVRTGYFALSLTADVQTVVALIEGPK